MAKPEECKGERNITITGESAKAIAFIKEQATSKLEAELAKLRTRLGGKLNELRETEKALARVLDERNTLRKAVGEAVEGIMPIVRAKAPGTWWKLLGEIAADLEAELRKK